MRLPRLQPVLTTLVILLLGVNLWFLVQLRNHDREHHHHGDDNRGSSGSTVDTDIRQATASAARHGSSPGGRGADTAGAAAHPPRSPSAEARAPQLARLEVVSSRQIVSVSLDGVQVSWRAGGSGGAGGGAGAPRPGRATCVRLFLAGLGWRRADLLTTKPLYAAASRCALLQSDPVKQAASSANPPLSRSPSSAPTTRSTRSTRWTKRTAACTCWCSTRVLGGWSFRSPSTPMARAPMLVWMEVHRTESTSALLTHPIFVCPQSSLHSSRTPTVGGLLS